MKAGIKRQNIEMYTSRLTGNGYLTGAQLADLEYAELMGDPFNIEASDVSKLLKLLYPDGKVEGRVKSVETLLDLIGEAVSPDMLDKIEDEQLSLEEFIRMTNCPEQFEVFMPKHIDRKAVVDKLRSGDLLGVALTATFSDNKHGGKTKFFASLSEKQKMAVLRLTGLEEVEQIFTGNAKNEGKTAYFAKLSDELKCKALHAFPQPSQVWSAKESTGKVKFFAALGDMEKLEVLKCTGLPEVERFNGICQEGKTEFFARLFQEQKRDALNARAASVAVARALM